MRFPPFCAIAAYARHNLHTIYSHNLTSTQSTASHPCPYVQPRIPAHVYKPRGIFYKPRGIKKRNKKYLKIFTFFSFTKEGKGFKEVATEGR
jgi:hypothetical protein